MAKNFETQSGFIEREGRRWAKIHAVVAIGALAAETALFPGSIFMEGIAELEAVHAIALEGIHRVAKNRRTHNPNPA
jgi:hypothetical protein